MPDSDDALLTRLRRIAKQVDPPPLLDCGDLKGNTRLWCISCGWTCCERCRDDEHACQERQDRQWAEITGRERR